MRQTSITESYPRTLEIKSENISTGTYNTKELNLTALPILKLSQEFSKQLDYMLDSVSHTEWSGLLFYKYRGSITDVSKMSFELIGLYPLNVGTGAYTEYKVSEHMSDVIKLYEEYPEYENCKIGHIHSHHSMGVFASGTDMDTLLGCVKDKQFDMLLSVIVNNRREMFAGVSFTTEIITRGTSVRRVLFNGEALTTEVPFESTVDDVMWTKCNCDLRRLHNMHSTLSHITSKVSSLLFSERGRRATHNPAATPVNFVRRTPEHFVNNADDRQLYEELEQFEQSGRVIGIQVDAAGDGEVDSKQLSFMLLDEMYNLGMCSYDEEGLFESLQRYKSKFDISLPDYCAAVKMLFPLEEESRQLLYSTASSILKVLSDMKRIPSGVYSKYRALKLDVDNVVATYYE